MDYRTKEGIEKEPTELRDDMRETRATLTEKLELLEDRVTEKSEAIQHRVEATVDKVKESVHDTVRAVRETVDWRHQMNEHPWAMFGGAVLAGLLADRLLAGATRMHVPATVAGSMPTHSVGSARSATAYDGPSLVQKALGQFSIQRDRLEHAAISAASDLVDRLISHALPGIGRHLH